MGLERRGQVIAIEFGSTGDGRNPLLNGRRQPSRDGVSRMTRECQVRLCEGLGVKFPGPTGDEIVFKGCFAYARDTLIWVNYLACRLS